MSTIRKISAVCGAVAMCATLSVVAGGAANAAGPAKSQTNILGSGSDVTFQLNNALNTLYNESPGCGLVVPVGQVQPLDFTCQPDTPLTVKTENYAHDVIRQAYPIGASNGIAQVCGNLSGVSFATNTRAFRSSDCTGLNLVAYARDGVAWLGFGGAHGVTNLSKAQLQGIFGSCTITNWSQVGGTPGPIKVYSILPGSGIKSVFDTYIGSDSNACSPAQGSNPSPYIIRQNQVDPILANGDQADAIFPVAISQNISVIKGKGGSAIGSVETIAPTETNVASGTYPIGFFVSNVYCAASTGAAPCPKKASKQLTNYVGPSGWICKAAKSGDPLNAHSTNPFTGNNYRTDIENTIRDHGFAPLPLGLTGGTVTGSSYCRLTSR